MKGPGKKSAFAGFIILGILAALPLQADLQRNSEIVVKLRLYEGMTSLAHEPQPFVTSSYLRPLVSASIPSGYEPEEEEKQIKRVFNLLDVRLLNEADMVWTSKEFGLKDYVLRFDSREMSLTIAPLFRNRFQVKISEQTGNEKVSLLDTEIILPRDNIAVFGFESTVGTPYFLSFRVLLSDALKTVPSKKTKSKGKVGGVVGGTFKGPVRAEGDIKPPKLIKKVDPVYPQQAKEAGVEGVVILEVTTDVFGRVANVRVLRSIPLLDQAAIDAVRQWVWEPLVLDGEPRGMIFNVTVAFRLKD